MAVIRSYDFKLNIFLSYSSNHEANYWVLNFLCNLVGLRKKIFYFLQSPAYATQLEIQTTHKGSLSMMEYVLNLKTLAENLVAITKSVLEKDQTLQILRGLGVDYNPLSPPLLHVKMMSPFIPYTTYSSHMSNDCTSKTQYQKMNSFLLMLPSPNRKSNNKKSFHINRGNP